MTTLHILPMDKFVPDFIRFVNDNFAESDQQFVTFGDRKKYPFALSNNHIHFGKLNFFYYLYVLVKSQFCTKIVLHSLLDIRIVSILFLNPWLLKKSYWVIWGGDLYSFKAKRKNFYWYLKEFIRRPVLKNIRNVVTNTDGDVELLKKWYTNVKVNYCKCLVYPSNIFSHEIPIIDRSNIKNNSLKILVGNSGIITNNHKLIFDWLKNDMSLDADIYCPLSYGPKSYIENVIELGYNYFGEKFNFNKTLVSLKEYIEFLKSIDICVFYHERQQGFGNSIQLLALGKTLFMNSKSPLFDELIRSGFIIKKTKEDTLENIQYSDMILNQKIISEKHSIYSLKTSLDKWIL